MHNIHIGRLIREELRRQGHTNEWFMERLGVSERTLQRLFHKSSLNTDQLFRISCILGTDFFQHYSEALPLPRQMMTPDNIWHLNNERMDVTLQNTKINE